MYINTGACGFFEFSQKAFLFPLQAHMAKSASIFNDHVISVQALSQRFVNVHAIAGILIT